jgi:translocation and assembly module TamB
VRIGLADPMRFAYANGILSIASADFKGTGTELGIRGTIPFESRQPLNLSANGTIDLGIIQGFNPSIKSSGQIKVQIGARGGMSSPSMQGQVAIENATFSSATFPVGLEGISGRIRVSGNRLEILQLNGMAGGGNLSASGFAIYGKQTSFNVSAQAKSIRLRYPPGLRTILSGNLKLAGTPAASSLTGQVLVDRLSFTQQFDMATLMSQLNSGVPTTAPPLFEQNMKLNVTVASANDLNAASTKLAIGGTANLTVNGTLADPVVLGRVVLTQGEVFFLGKRYDIQSGTIAFTNPARTEPVLDIYAKTTVEQYNITLNFMGPVDHLRTNYTSDPPLSEADIIHLIAFGTTAEEAATTSTPASVAAESVLAQGVSSQVGGKLEKLTGISQITLDPLVTNSTADPASQIAIQQRVSGSLLVTFATDVTSAQAQTVEVKYQAKKNMAVSVIRDYNGGYAIDIRLRKSF